MKDVINYKKKEQAPKLYSVSKCNFSIFNKLCVEYEKIIKYKPTEKFLNLFDNKTQKDITDKLFHSQLQFDVNNNEMKLLLSLTTKQKGGALHINYNQFVRTKNYIWIVKRPEILTNSLYFEENINHKLSKKLEDDLYSNSSNIATIMKDIEAQEELFNTCVQKTMSPAHCYELLFIKLANNSHTYFEMYNTFNGGA